VQNTPSVWTNSTTTPVTACWDMRECSVSLRQMNAKVDHVPTVPLALIWWRVTNACVLRDLR
ncbi:hypothetical protein M9458_027291, partial [Cirrhinus mrigala]